MTFSTETLTEIEQLAGCGWTVEELAMYLEVPYDLLLIVYNDLSSEFRLHHDRGILKSHAERDKALSSSAAAGSVTAVQIIEKRMRDRELIEFKERLLNGT